MSIKPHKKPGKHSFSSFRIAAFLCILPGLAGLLWYSWTRLSRIDESSIHAGQLLISNEKNSCQLNIPEGTLSIQRPLQSALGARSPLSARVSFAEPVSFSDCSGGIPSWKLQIEAQSELVGAEVEPGALIRQPLSDRTDIEFNWNFDFPYVLTNDTSHFWLRILVLEGTEIIERWTLLVREFPMRSVSFLGLSAAVVIPLSLSLIVIGILLLVSEWVSKKKKGKRF